MYRQIQIIDEFSDICFDGRLVICGGEPMLDVNTYFEVCRVAHDRGLRVLSVVNGTMITNLEDAKRVVRAGPDEISISLDGPSSDIHDRLRGWKGAFDQATQAVRLLVEARRASAHNLIRINVMGLLSAYTYRELDAFYTLVLHELGADKLKLNAIQPTFANTRLGQYEDRQMKPEGDVFFARESQVDPELLELALRACCQKFDLNFNPVWLSQMVGYFRVLWGNSNLHLGWLAGAETQEPICNSYDRNIMVDVNGRASFCFSNGFPSFELRNPGDLTRFWTTKNDEVYAPMRTCKLLCGISHSVRREHATHVGQPLNVDTPNK